MDEAHHLNLIINYWTRTCLETSKTNWVKQISPQIYEYADVSTKIALVGAPEGSISYLIY